VIKLRTLKEKGRSKKGISAILGAIILFTILFSTGATYFLFATQTYQMQQIAGNELTELKIDQEQEQFLVTGAKELGSVGVVVNNTGPLTIIVENVFVMDDDGNMYTFLDSESSSSLPLTVNSGDISSLVNTNVEYVNGTLYVIKVITERGNMGIGYYPPLYDITWIRTSISQIAKGVGSLLLDQPRFNFRFYYCSDYPLNQWDQSGYLTEGYPAYSLPKTTPIIFAVNIYNGDYSRRDIRLNPMSMVSLGAAPDPGNNYYIVKDVIFDDTDYSIIPLLNNETIILPYQQTTKVYFTTASSGGDNPDSSPSGPSPYGVFMLLYGSYEDTRPFAQTIPFVTTWVTAGAEITNMNVTSGGTGTGVIFMGPRVGFNLGEVEVGWINIDGTITSVGSGIVQTSGMSSTFTVPEALEGNYVIIVTDGINSAFATFYHTGE
jgi:hypothetical protein